MLEASSFLQNNSIQDQLSVQTVQTSEAEKNQANKSQFLELMIAQLKNQNPLDPQDGAQFLSQLAQFSSVEGIQKLNVSMNEMAAGFRSGQALQATALVGRQVQVPGQFGDLSQGSSLSGSVELPVSSTQVNLQIKNNRGELVREVSLGSHDSGNIPFKWDGLDAAGQAVTSGRYQISATALQDGETVSLETNIAVNVNSVTLGKDGEVTVNLNGLGPVPLSEVKSIN